MPSTYVLLKKLWKHVPKRRRHQFLLILFIMCLTSFFEILGIGSLIPLLGAITNPGAIIENRFIFPILNVIGITTDKSLVIFLAALFIFLTATTNSLRLFVLWASSRLSLAVGTELSLIAYRNVLYQPYEIHITRNIGEVVHGVLAKVSSAASQIGFVMTLISSSLLASGILLAIVLVNPVIAMSAFVILGLIYYFTAALTKERLIRNSAKYAKESEYVMASMIEGLGGIRDVLIDGLQEVYANVFYERDQRSRRALGNIQIIGGTPRFVIETIGVSSIVIVAVSLSIFGGDVIATIPVLGAIALGAQRLLPVLQNAFYAWSNLQGNRLSLQEAIEFLDASAPLDRSRNHVGALPFNKSIKFENISYCYPNQKKQAISNVDLLITKGSKVGLIGKTASGKSTLIDLIMGLLRPTSGLLKIDDIPVDINNFREWQLNLAHVPQSIFLADTSIAENIAFGIPKIEIDYERVKTAARIAQLSDDMSDLSKRVGERGILLSGGQKQRIGIARAIYKNVSTYIFDEATSALDSRTEERVINALEEWASLKGGKLTFIFVAHRESTLKNCDFIVEVGEGQIKRVGTYKEVVESNLKD